MKAFLWSLCVHIVLLGLLTYHHFAPTEAAKPKSEPPILAYAYQPVKAKPKPAVVAPAVAAPAKEIAAKTVTRPVQKAPAKSAVKKAVVKKPVVKRQPQPVKPKPKAAVVKPQTAATQPRKAFVPVRKPAMVKPLPVVAKAPNPQPIPALTAAQTVPKVVPAPPAVVAAKVPAQPPAKPAEPVAAKVVPQAAPVAVVAAKALPEPQPEPAQPVPVIKPAAVTPEPRPIASTAATNKTEVKAALNEVSASRPQGTSVASNALQKARQGDASGSASWKEKQQQLALEITRVKPEQKPEMGRKVKTFADGSSLIDTNPGCWKVPPAESRKNAIWLSTSVPCKRDTTVEQIEAILEKRRSYSRD